MNDALLELELSRYRGWLPGRSGAAWGRLAAAFALLFVFCLGLDHYLQLRSFGHAGALATIFALGAGSALLYFSENFQRFDSSYAWWIRLPHSRFELVKARFLAFCAVGYVFYAIVWTAGISAHALRAFGGEPAAVEPSNGLAAPAVIGLAAVPVVAAFGMLGTVFQRRRWYAVLAGYAHMVVGVGGATGLLGIAIADETLMLRLAEGPLWTAALVTIGAGWPLAYGMLRLAAKYGIANLADNRNRMTPERRAAKWKRVRPGAAAGEASTAAIRSPRHALFRLEWKRITLYADTLPGRIAACVLLAGLAVGGWFAYGDSMAAVLVPIVPTAIATYLLMLSVSITFSTDIQLRKLDWQLLLPMTRRHLVLGKLAAYWTAGLAVAASVYGSVWLGMIVRCLIEGQPLASLAHDAAWAVYCFALGGVVFAGVVALVFGSLAASVSIPLLSIMLVLVYLVPAFLNRQLTAFYFPSEDRMGAATPYWDLLGMTAAAALAVTIVYVAIAARTIDSLVKAKPRQQGRAFGGKPSA